MQQYNTITKRHYYQMQGVSLIEVLVALLLVSISGFSVLAMSSFSTQESNSLRFEITADYLGQSLLARIQANIHNDNQHIYTFDTNTASPNHHDCHNGCTILDIAATDVAEWTKEINTALPDAQYSAWWNKNQFKIAIAWTGPTQNNMAVDCPFKPQHNTACRVYTANIALLSTTLEQ